MPVVLFPFGQYWLVYAGFLVFVLAVLAIDLGVFNRKAHTITFREAAAWSAVWVALSLIVNAVLYRFALWRFSQDERLLAVPGFVPRTAARNVALEFLSGYVVEYSLSVDNLFVFVLIFTYFAIPTQYQHRVLYYGILGALVFRGIFIVLGALLLKFQWVLYVFGGFLVLTGAKMAFSDSDEKIDPEKNPMIRLFRRVVPVTTVLEGPQFFVKEAGRLAATPLFIALLALEMTDIVFAIDSVPAIFALTREPLVVFTSNVCAILGLRSLYFLLSGAMDKFHLLKYGISAVLVFVGLKMTVLHHFFEGKFPTGLSLAIITGVIGVSVVLSLAFPRKS